MRRFEPRPFIATFAFALAGVCTLLPSQSTTCRADDHSPACPRKFQSLVSQGSPLPTSLKYQLLDLRAPGPAEVAQLRKGTSYRYVVDRDDQLWLAPQQGSDPSFSPESLWLVADSKGQVNAGGLMLPKEAGILSYDESAKSFVLKPGYRMDLSGEEILALDERARTALADSRVKRAEGPAGVARSRFVQCSEILAQQAKGDHFIRDRLISDNAVFLGALTLTETAAWATDGKTGQRRLNTENGREVMFSDWIGTNVGSFLGGALGLKLAKQELSITKDLAIRLGFTTGMLALQNGIYRQTVEGDPEGDVANEVTLFNAKWYAVRTPISLAMDRSLLKSIPMLFFEACARNSKMKILVSPTAVRLYDSTTFSIIYLGLRDAAIGK